MLREHMANQYNTFKFYYRDGCFTWAHNPTDYREPLRYPGIRLYNGLTMLIDLGLIEEDEKNVCSLTNDGHVHLARVTEAGCGD